VGAFDRWPTPPWFPWRVSGYANAQVSGLGSGVLSLCCEFSFNIQTRLSSVRGSMTKLVDRRDATILHASSRFVGAGIRMSEHGYIDAADRCCLRRITWLNICLIFTAATRLSFHRQSPVAVCVHLPSCQGCCTRAWGLGRRRFRVTQAKPNENETKFHYRLIIYSIYFRLRKKFKSLNGELWMSQREKPSPNRGYRFLKTELRKPSFRFLNFEVGSVFRKPISEIFIGFLTPLGKMRNAT